MEGVPIAHEGQNEKEKEEEEQILRFSSINLGKKGRNKKIRGASIGVGTLEIGGCCTSSRC